MRKITLLLIIMLSIFTLLIGCSKKTKEPYLNLSYRYTNTTLLVEYKEGVAKKSYEYELGKHFLKIKQNSKVHYKSSNYGDKCTLLIQRTDTKEKVKEIILDNVRVDTTVPKGKYIYNFYFEGENRSARFIKLIEIE